MKAVVTAADLPQSADRIVDLGEGETPLSYIRGNVLASARCCTRATPSPRVAAISAHVAEEAAR